MFPRNTRVRSIIKFTTTFWRYRLRSPLIFLSLSLLFFSVFHCSVSLLPLSSSTQVKTITTYRTSMMKLFRSLSFIFDYCFSSFVICSVVSLSFPFLLFWTDALLNMMNMWFLLLHFYSNQCRQFFFSFSFRFQTSKVQSYKNKYLVSVVHLFGFEHVLIIPSGASSVFVKFVIQSKQCQRKQTEKLIKLKPLIN